MAGTFRVDRSFALKGRGLVIAGEIASGTVQAGATVTIPDAKGIGRSRRITSVETGTGLNARGEIGPFVGLVLGTLPLPDLAAAQAYFASNQLLTIADPVSDTQSLFPD